MRTKGVLFAFLSMGMVASCSVDGEDGAVADASSSIDASVSQPPDARPSPDATPAPDAAPAALTCAGEALPTTVTSPPVVISGQVQSVATISGPEPLNVSANIRAFYVEDDDLLVQTNSVVGNGSNTFSLTDPTSSTTPLSAYVRATAPGHIDTYLYAPYDIYEDFTNAIFLMFGEDLYGLVSLVAGVTQVEGNGVIMVIVADCDEEPVGGATISLSPSVGDIRYGDANGLPSSSLTSTGAQGIAFIFNVPPGDYVVDAERDGVSLREHPVAAFADAATTTIVVP
jgi:hypothetical protein